VSEERVSITVAGGATLEGVLSRDAQRHERGAVIAPPHPLYGGTLDNPVVVALARALEQRGLATLRFNWRGVGGSSGVASGDLEPAVDDFTAAVDHLAEAGYEPAVAAGYSFGAATAVKVALDSGGRSALALVAPPLQMLGEVDVTRLTGRVSVVVADDDVFAPAADIEERLRPLSGATITVAPASDHFFSRFGVDELVATFLDAFRD